LWRELVKDILTCEEVVNLIKAAVLMKTVWGNSDCYKKQVREFLVNIPEECDNFVSKEFQKVLSSAHLLSTMLNVESNVVTPVKGSVS
ncbi:envelope-like protein, partial [Trifolium medium]|nr:envelope-like protein [Trifolium medium]